PLSVARACLFEKHTACNWTKSSRMSIRSSRIPARSTKSHQPARSGCAADELACVLSSHGLPAISCSCPATLWRTAMRLTLPTVTIAGALIITAIFSRGLSPTSAQVQTKARYLPEYAASGDLLLPKNFHEWVFVGSPLTPNALNGGEAGFPEY